MENPMSVLYYNEAIVWASGELLCSIFPNDWRSMRKVDKDDFMLSACHSEDVMLSADELWTKIVDLADSVLALFDSLGEKP